jgi:hypothetical protein
MTDESHVGVENVAWQPCGGEKTRVGIASRVRDREGGDARTRRPREKCNQLTSRHRG